MQNFKSTLIFNFDNKRHNFYYTHKDNKYTITGLKDNTGKLLQNLNSTSSNKQDSFEYQMDYTDAHVNRVGNTNAADIRAELNSNCGGDPACRQNKN